MYLLRQPRSSRWYVAWKDHRGKYHRWAAFPSKSLSERYGRILERVVQHRMAGESLPADLRQWLRELPGPRLVRLERLGIIEKGTIGGAPLSVLLDAWEDHLEALGRTQHHVKQTVFRARSTMDGLGATKVESIDPVKLVAYMRRLRSRANLRDKLDPATQSNLSSSTVNHYLTALQSFVMWCVSHGHAESNPIRNVRKLQVGVEGIVRDRRAMTDDERRKLLSKVKPVSTDRWSLYLFALATGLRRGEIAKLKVSDVDLKGGWVRVPAAYSRKAKRLRTVPLSKETTKALKTIWRGRNAAESAFKIPRRSSEAFRADLERAGIKVKLNGQVLDFHALRHSFCTSAGYAAESFADLMELMGHKTPAMTARYSHAQADRMKRAVEKMA